MQCPDCQFENREAAKFCNKCGYRFHLTCPECGQIDPLESKFCSECGCNLKFAKEVSNAISDAKSLSQPPIPVKSTGDIAPITGERKHVTVLFSDLTGYTAMCEKLDPEEVKEITSHIFGEISKIVVKYDGFIEKYAGDAVMVLFGATETHEDDPVRAIKAAQEIHKKVDLLSPQYEEQIEHHLVMHTGINTGLVVTGNVNFEIGTHGVAGDTINVAARLSALGNAGEILVGPNTFYQGGGYFDFKKLEPVLIKGKSAPIQVYKVLSQKEQPIKIHRLHGFRAELIGRNVEMNHLKDAARKLKEGIGGVISIHGTAGTGKSRLIQEFKASLNLEEIQWLEGQAYPYSQNISYSPLINLLSRSMQIEEGDPADKIMKKVEAGLGDLIGKDSGLIPYVGSLFSLKYPEIEDVSPDYWKAQLQKSVKIILETLSERARTVVCLEDLHWADPSFLNLIRLLVSEYRGPVLFLCVYRPTISLFTIHEISTMINPYLEIRIRDLSISESQGMVASLLRTDEIPFDLQRFLQDKVEGNPFYIEEVINSLIESEALIRDNGSWQLTREISESEISSTIHGLISGRLDRLEKESKRILQEASVIGRTFYYEILNRVTELNHQVDKSLRSLERLDLIRARALQPDLEYIFKHALTQEVVYYGLLKKERQIIHERIGLVIERLFHDRMPEFFETLAYHFQQGQSTDKAVDYLMKSGNKSAKRNAFQESHLYYKDAFDLLFYKPNRSQEDNLLIIDLLNQWAFVFSYRGDIKGLDELLRTHVELVESVGDNARIGEFYGWLAVALWFREGFIKAYQYLEKGLKLGEKAESQHVIGEVCTWLCYVGCELGFYNIAIKHGERAHSIAKTIKSDHWLHIKSLDALGYVYFSLGDKSKAMEIGRNLLNYSQKHSYIRGMVLGHCGIGRSYLIDGDIQSAIESFKKGTQVAGDPMYYQVSNIYLGISFLLNGQLDQAHEIFLEIIDFSQEFGIEAIGSVAQGCKHVISIAKGEMSQGLKLVQKTVETNIEIGRAYWVAFFEFIIGKIFSQIAVRANPMKLSTITRNFGFLMKNVPFANKNAEIHYANAIEVAKKNGAKSILGLTYFDLGLLHKAKKRKDQAKECITKAIKLFELCEADVYKEHANEVLESLE